MATYQSILHKAADAINYAFGSIAGADLPSCTRYLDDGIDDISLPAVVISCTAETLADPTGTVSSENFRVTVNISAESMADTSDTSRTVHGQLAGIVEAVFFRSADQVVTECNAAGVTDFTAERWTPLSITQEKEPERRRTILSGALICTSR